MAANSTPTARRKRLGSELRKLRERAGITATEAAALLGGNQARISNIEAGRYGVSADRVRTLACHYHCPDHELVDALASMTGERRRGWWEEYRGTVSPGLLDLAELEHHGTALRTSHTSGLPGLLQTTDHAREVFRQVVPPLPPPEIENRLSFRMKRQTVIFRSNPVPYRAVIHEAALHMRFGGTTTTREQLRHILSMSEREHITVQVIPFAAGGYPGAGQPAYYVHGPVPQLDTVQLDQSHGVVLLDGEALLQKYRHVFARLETLAHSATDSRALIRTIIRDL
ncbi:helix-turn-helix domain-containing protein [Streptomyces griseus]|uniref:helix-turn-helix domain-containing protein n=1 Tax=Streptomyces griseus TaxID=1911 RepID=UPI0008405E57|nr:helix-turn-helix transcriptional regulator [Streptomyces griseus]